MGRVKMSFNTAFQQTQIEVWLGGYFLGPIPLILSAAAARLPSLGALALIMVAAMTVTPFRNNAATVLVMAPIAANFANSLGYSPDPFLMAVAMGAACDFLTTPIGHQSNLLVMGPGGYSFGDYWRLGLPLSIMAVIVGVPLIALFWLFRPV
jgi:di/tricarboxylate transporter